jgi:hypothetical protein
MGYKMNCDPTKSIVIQGPDCLYAQYNEEVAPDGSMGNEAREVDQLDSVRLIKGGGDETPSIKHVQKPEPTVLSDDYVKTDRKTQTFLRKIIERLKHFNFREYLVGLRDSICKHPFFQWLISPFCSPKKEHSSKEGSVLSSKEDQGVEESTPSFSNENSSSKEMVFSSCEDKVVAESLISLFKEDSSSEEGSVFSLDENEDANKVVFKETVTASLSKEGELLYQAGGVISSIDDALFRGTMAIQKNRILKEAEMFLKTSKRSSNSEIKKIREVITQIQKRLKKKQFEPSSLVGIISKTDQIAVMEKCAPHSLLIMTKTRFVEQFKLIVMEACSRISPQIQTVGVFRLAGARLLQPQLMKECIEGKTASFGRADVNDWCDILKALILEYRFLEESRVLSCECEAELRDSMGMIEELLLNIIAHKDQNKMAKENIEIAAKEIISVLNQYGLSEFDCLKLDAESFF